MGRKISMSLDINVNKFIMTNVFEPTDIAGALLWLDASDSATLALDGSNVISWTDKVSSAAFAQISPSARPVINSSYFGKNCVDFGESTNKWLNTSSTITVGSAATYFVVNRWGNRSGYCGLFIQNGTATNAATTAYPLFFQFNASGLTGALQMSDVGSYNYTPSPLQSPGTNSQHTLTVNGAMSNGTIRSNGSDIADSGVGTWSGGNINTVGSTDSFYPVNGAFAEIIVYNRVLTNEEILQVEGYLKDKWGTP